MYVVMIRPNSDHMWEAVFASRNIYVCQFMAFLYLWRYEVDVRYSPRTSYR